MSNYVIKISKKPGYLNWQYEAGDLDGYMLRSGNDVFTVTKDIKYATKFNKSEAEQLINSPHYKTPTYKYYKFDIIEYTENSKYNKLFSKLDNLSKKTNSDIVPESERYPFVQFNIKDEVIVFFPILDKLDKSKVDKFNNKNSGDLLGLGRIHIISSKIDWNNPKVIVAGHYWIDSNLNLNVIFDI